MILGGFFGRVFYRRRMVFWMENGCWAEKCELRRNIGFGRILLRGGKWDFWAENKVLGEMVCWDFFSWEHWFAWENGFSEETVLLSKIGLGDNGPLGGKVYLCRFITLQGLGFGRQKGFVRIFCWGGGALGFGRKYFGTENRLWRKCVFLGGGEESGYLEEMGSGRNGVLEETGAWEEKVVLGGRAWF